MQVDSTAVDAAGRIWVTLSSGPRCSSNVAGCGPIPNSCAGEVITINASTAKLATVLKATRGELIADAQPSPNGALLAYLDGTCNKSYSNQHLVIRDITSGQSWTIGTALEVCHSLSSLSWTPDSKNIVVTYGASLVASADMPANYGSGLCRQPGPGELVVVPALAAATRLPGAAMPMEPNCQIEATTATRGGYAAIEICGVTDHDFAGPAYLVLINPALQVTSRSQIGTNVGDAELRADANGTNLLGTIGVSPARTVTFTDTGSGPRDVLSQANGYTTVTSVSW